MALRNNLLLLVSFCLASVAAWQAAPPLQERRAFLVQAPCAAIAAALFTPLSAVAISTESAQDQWKRSTITIDNLLDGWSTVGGGDNIRVQLGTQGTTSPLFQIDKALKVLRQESEDIVEFTDQAEEFQLALARADSMAYSANFAGGSGKPTPPSYYIEKSKTEVELLQKIAKSLTALL